MSGKRKNFYDRLDASALNWTPGGRKLITEIYDELEKAYVAGHEDGKAEGFVAGVQEHTEESDDWGL